MTPLLQASDIHFAYNDRPALRGVSISLTPGQIIALLGPNGSGKSTFIKVLLGHLHATGQILWNQKDIRQWTRREIAKSVAYLPQSPAYDPTQTVLDVLRLGRAPYWGAFGIESTADEKIVHDIATLLQLDDLLNRPMEEMSGGQRQRVFVGRCLAQQPKALLLDEPSTFLDIKHQFDLCRMLKGLSHTQNLGIIMASHDLNLAGAFADHLMILSEGAIAAAGSSARSPPLPLATKEP
jgi:iron complex transport system ATP-binding protein